MNAFDDVYYTASLIEYLGRKTKNHRRDIAEYIGIEGTKRLLRLADVNHCLSFEQVSEELIERYGIHSGNFDNVAACKFNVPSYTSIGRVYARLTESVSCSPDDYAETLYNIFVSPISDAISNFNSSLYFAPADEIAYYYETRYAG